MKRNKERLIMLNRNHSLEIYKKVILKALKKTIKVWSRRDNKLKGDCRVPERYIRLLQSPGVINGHNTNIEADDTNWAVSDPGSVICHVDKPYFFVSRKLGPDESPDVFLAELRRLATLFGGVSEKALACAFVAGLPENVRQQLKVRSRMGYLGLSQILTRARAIITDERPVDAPNTCLSARGPGVQSPTAPPGQRCFECGGPNHFARDCLARRQGGDPGKRARDRGISASLLSPRPLTEALPAVRKNVGGIRRRVLVDTGCTVCVAHASCCRSWRKEDVAITTMCGRAMGCEGTGVVQLRPHGKGPIEVEVIVVRSKPLGYDLILGMNGIAALGGVMVSGGRCVRFGLDGLGVCAATEAGISIREKDFTATYCPSTRSWTAASAVAAQKSADPAAGGFSHRRGTQVNSSALLYVDFQL
ncbi:hypothetical protein T08_5899 [Trichinella sp. T8]|nr:hypothetical protein T08_5899 [Trichinella sp. T8]